MQQIYGWAGLQFQTWARGHIINKSSRRKRVALHAEGVLEYTFNGQHLFGGDFYGFRRAATVVDLLPGGKYTEFKMLEGRASGAQLPPSIPIEIMVTKVAADLVRLQNSMVFPEPVDRTLPNNIVSLVLRSNAQKWVSIIQCSLLPTNNAIDVNTSPPTTTEGIQASLLATSTVRIAPGRSRPVSLKLDSRGLVSFREYRLHREYQVDDHNQREDTSASVHLRSSSVREVSKMTFLYSSGIVSYAMI